MLADARAGDRRATARVRTAQRIYKSFLRGWKQCEQPRGIGGLRQPCQQGRRPRSGESPEGLEKSHADPGPLDLQSCAPVMPECYCAFAILSLCSHTAYKAQPTSNGTRTPTTLYAATEPATTQHRRRFQCMCEAMRCVATSREPAEGTLQAQERACTPACLHRTKANRFGLQRVEGCIEGGLGIPVQQQEQPAQRTLKEGTRM